MTETVSPATRQETGSQPASPSLGGLIHRDHVVADLCVASRKRLFEELAALLVNGGHLDVAEEMPTETRVFSTLHDRERLGCTALGHGIAVPHGRLEGLNEPAIVVAKLREPVDYDAADRVPVWLAVCLLVPQDANEVHLNLLAALAAQFSDQSFIDRVKSSQTTDQLYEIFRAL